MIQPETVRITQVNNWELSRHDVSNEVFVSIEGLKNEKERYGLKGLKKRKPLHHLKQKTGSIHMLSESQVDSLDIRITNMDSDAYAQTFSAIGFLSTEIVSFVTEIHTLSIEISLRDCLILNWCNIAPADELLNQNALIEV
ncbi:hypothetical protein Tco_1299606 [Tanacetum coccineum]